MDLTAKKLSWNANRAKMPTARGGLASATLNNVVYTFGGEGDYSNPAGVYNETEAYDPRADKWTKLTIMKHPVHGTCAVIIGDKIYIAGGGDLKGGAPVDTFNYFSL
jgi:N-acetylneuraminic acid mutarotase